MARGEGAAVRARHAMRFRPVARGARGNGAKVREAVLGATKRLLEERRLDELTVVDLIEEAKVSRAAFYMYFESKHAVVAAWAHEVIDEVFEDVWRPWLSGSEPADVAVVTDHMRRTIALWREHQAILVATAQAWRAHADVYDGWGDIMRRYIADTRAYIERARASGAAPSTLDAGTLAAVLVWGNESALYLTFTGSEPELEDDENLATTLAAVWWQAIYGSSTSD